MKDINLDDIAEKVQSLHPEVDIRVIRTLIKTAFTRIGRVVDGGKDRFILRKCDIMHIYTPYDRAAVDLEFADLDETKLPSRKQSKALKALKILN